MGERDKGRERVRMRCLLSSVRSHLPTAVQEIDKEDANASVDIQNQVGRLGQGVRLHRQGVVEVLGAWEVFAGVLPEELDPLIGILLSGNVNASAKGKRGRERGKERERGRGREGERKRGEEGERKGGGKGKGKGPSHRGFDSVSDARNASSFLLHGFDEVVGRLPKVLGLLHVPGSIVNSAPKPRPNREDARGKTRGDVLGGACVKGRKEREGKEMRVRCKCVSECKGREGKGGEGRGREGRGGEGKWISPCLPARLRWRCVRRRRTGRDPRI